MKPNTLLSVAVVLALMGSYMTWTHTGDESADLDTIAMYRATAADLQTIRWKGEKITIETEQKSDDNGSYLLVTTTEQIKVKTDKKPAHDHEHGKPPTPETEPEGEQPEGEGDGTVTEEPPKEEEPQFETKVNQFVGNKSASELWQNFSPLQALRHLPGSESLDKASFGLDEPKATIEVVTNSGAMQITVGGESYGTKDKYLSYQGEIYLVKAANLRTLQYGKSRLIERNLQPITEKDADSVTVTQGTQRSKLVHRFKDDRSKNYWGFESNVEQAAEGAETWLKKLFRLRVQSYIASEEQPTGLQEVASFEVAGEEASWKVLLLQDPSDEQYYAQSDFNRMLTKLTNSLVSEVVLDLPAAFGAGEEKQEQEQELEEALQAGARDNVTVVVVTVS